ncbi:MULTISPECIES: hypothetical protein [Acidiphilium]|uniref:hypothetical protein n=1 Tax=Acidiphilium TaxID=522 RepID=UPI00258046A9|nr:MULTISPECIES: hypothetical protein [Acidiphilium]HQT84087.1 hypothetical protein [Acidiphilium rubrum]
MAVAPPDESMDMHGTCALYEFCSKEASPFNTDKVNASTFYGTNLNSRITAANSSFTCSEAVQIRCNDHGGYFRPERPQPERCVWHRRFDLAPSMEIIVPAMLHIAPLTIESSLFAIVTIRAAVGTFMREHTDDFGFVRNRQDT